jgi:GGDEF domain-containing protein
MLEKLATRDTLTNLLNIRKFREILTAEIESLNRCMDDCKDMFLSVMMIDADHLSTIMIHSGIGLVMRL